MIKVGVLGATGYTGFETVKIIERHKEAKLIFATSESSAGKSLAELYPTPLDVPLISKKNAPFEQVDAVFCCLPHGASMQVVAVARQAGVRVIDLSADFRLSNIVTYQRWYGLAHIAPKLLTEAVYGLSEINRSLISQTDLIANPGCYPTSLLLALYPLLTNGLLNTSAPIISDSKSGVSGAGRKATLTTHFVEANENLSPYNIGQNHRHIAEMSENINSFGGADYELIFSPHLVPVSRGMLSTIYILLNKDMSLQAVRELYNERYAAEPFIRLLPAGQLASMAHTQHTNQCVLSITEVNPRRFILCSSIDNLGKGAAGQAIQNFNIMFGLNETEGLI